MKNILFITNTSLAQAKRGTPLRIISVAKQIAKEHQLWVVAKAVPTDLNLPFIAYPQTNFFSKFWIFYKLIKQNKIDTVFANTDMEIILPVFLKIATGVKIVMDIHGLYAEEMYYEKLISRPKKYLIDLVIRFFLLFYDLIFVCSHKLVDYYPAVSKKMVVLYNGVEEELFNNPDRLEPAIFTIGYAGNLKAYQGFDYLLQACQQIRQQHLFDFRLNLILSSGTSDIAEKLKQYNLLDISDLHFKVEHGEVRPIISQSSVLVIPRPSLPLTEYAYPSKMPGDLLTGIPTIITIVGPIEQLLSKANVSILIKTDDISANIVSALVTVKNMSQVARNDLGKRAIAFVKSNLTWDVLGIKINQSLKQI